jgi:hypothetical protein
MYDMTGLGGKGTLYLLGDVHFSDDHACTPCKAADGCASVTAFIDRLAADKTRQLDVFVELPYIPRPGQTGNRSRALSALDRRFGTSAASMTRGQLRDGASDIYVGVLGHLFKRYRDRIYDRPSRDLSHMRVHFADIRLEPNVNVLLRPEWVNAHVTSVDMLRAVMRAFMYGPDFVGEITRAVGAVGAQHIATTTLSSDKCHKVAKQFLASPDNAVKGAMRKYLDDRLEELMVIFVHEVGFPLAPSPRNHPTSDMYYKEWLGDIWAAHIKAYNWALARAVRFGLRVLVMDAYLVGRMMRFGTQGDAVIYVGDSHADLYARFLHDYLALQPKNSHLADSRRSRGGRERRCVSLTG